MQSPRQSPRAFFTTLCLLLACGPKLPADDTDSSDATTAAPTDTGSTTGATGVDPTSTSSTAAPTTADPTSTTGTSTGGCSFLDCTTSNGPVCAVGEGASCECDVWTQDCPDGQKCMPWANDGSSAWNALKCVDVMPNAGKPGDECTVEGNGVSGIDSCEKASMCWHVSQETGKGICVGFCTGSQEAPQCADPKASCVIANDGVLILCLPGCDPLTQDCADTEVCIPQPMGDKFICVLDASGDAGKQNDPCEYANACDPGLICANPALAGECDPMAAGCCLPFCDLSNPQCTNQGALCLPWYDMEPAPPGLENVGICGLMQ